MPPIGEPIFRSWSSRPTRLSNRAAFGWIETPAPISLRTSACSNTATSRPRARSASAAVRPPMPPPTIAMRSEPAIPRPLPLAAIPSHARLPGGCGRGYPRDILADRHDRNWLRLADLKPEHDLMPIERIDRAKIEAGPDGSPERLPKFSETVRSDGSGKSGRAVSIGDRIVDLHRDALLDRQGAVIALRPRAWLVLKFLAQRPGRLVEKNELLEEVWAACVVTEDSLVQAIGDIRRALGDAGRTALRTLPRRGYMLVTDESRPGIVTEDSSMELHPASIGDRLRAKASKRFVGRESELALLREAISRSQPSTPLFFVHGPGGIGKTTLLEHLRAEAAVEGIVFVRIDVTGVSPKPDAILAALANALGLSERAATLEQVVAGFSRDRGVLAVDSFESLGPMSSWVRDTLLAALPSQITVVLAGRQVPDTRWTAHPLWCDAMRCIGLVSLSRAESGRLLDVHGVAADARSGMLDLCHGHPLALV